MSDAWVDCSLGDMVTLQRGHDLPSHARKPGSVPIISSSGLSGYHDTPKASPPGVITGRYGTIGEVFYIEEPYWPLNTALYAVDFKGNSPRFIYYYLKTIDYQSVNDKSGVPGINRNDLHALPATCPSPRIQQSIAEVLGSLDDRIALNDKLSAALEATAAAVFKSWFVDFDPVVAKSEGRKPFGMTDEIAALFPDRFAPNGLPEGWKPGKFGDIAMSIRKGVNPSLNDLPYVGLEHIPRKRITLDDWGHSSDVSSQKASFSRGDILFGKLVHTSTRFLSRRLMESAQLTSWCFDHAIRKSLVSRLCTRFRMIS